MDGDLDRVKYLVHKGTEPNLRDSSGYAALVRLLGRLLCFFHYYEPELLYHYFVFVCQHYASRSGHLAVCEFLLEKGACASPQTQGGATPLHRSAYCGHLDVVRLLLHHRADPMLCDDDGASPLHKVQSYQQNIMKQLQRDSLIMIQHSIKCSSRLQNVVTKRCVGCFLSTIQHSAARQTRGYSYPTS